MTEDLKRCPFCGASAAVMKDNGNENWPIKIWIQCDGCKMRGLPVEGPSCYGYNARFDKRDLPEAAALAVAAWNRRAAPSQPEGAEPIDGGTLPTEADGLAMELVDAIEERDFLREQVRELRVKLSAGAAAPDEGEAANPFLKGSSEHQGWSDARAGREKDASRGYHYHAGYAAGIPSALKGEKGKS